MNKLSSSLPCSFSLLAVCGFASLLFASCEHWCEEDALESVEAAVPSLAQVVAEQANYELITPEPVYVNAELMFLCRGLLRSDVEEQRKTHGQHAVRSIHIRMNPVAAEAFRAERRPWPVGSVIIKDKDPLTVFELKDGSYDKESLYSFPAGVGGMIKRAPGYDAEHGDWQYFYYEDAAEVESGRLANCIQCHLGARERDYVFADWAKFVNSRED